MEKVTNCRSSSLIRTAFTKGIYWILLSYTRNVGKPVTGRATNNCGEIQASTLAIQLAGDCGVKKLCINTDSQFLINSITKWIAGWKRKGWKVKSGEPVKNVVDFKALDAVMAKYSITLKWVSLVFIYELFSIH